MTHKCYNSTSRFTLASNHSSYTLFSGCRLSFYSRLAKNNCADDVFVRDERQFARDERQFARGEDVSCERRTLGPSYDRLIH